MWIFYFQTWLTHKYIHTQVPIYSDYFVSIFLFHFVTAWCLQNPLGEWIFSLLCVYLSTFFFFFFFLLRLWSFSFDVVQSERFAILFTPFKLTHRFVAYFVCCYLLTFRLDWQMPKYAYWTINIKICVGQHQQNIIMHRLIW